jgi:hypothetical protein
LLVYYVRKGSHLCLHALDFHVQLLSHFLQELPPSCLEQETLSCQTPLLSKRERLR